MKRSQSGTSERRYFKLVPTADDTEILCTFPGHWMVMNGEMIVE
jgi:azurin